MSINTEPVYSQYYDCENLTESTLSFRNAVNEPRYHAQDDNYCMAYLYGIDRYIPVLFHEFSRSVLITTP